jgi:hypothetical protein
MKSPFADLTFRQKRLWVEFAIDLTLLATFLALTQSHLATRRWATLILMLSYLAPIFYDTLKIHSGEDQRIDERDRLIETRGLRAGYSAMAVGLYLLIVWFSDDPSHIIAPLLALWFLARLLKNSTQLRCYAGHEAWWPDALIARQKRRHDKIMQRLGERDNS